MALVGYGRFNRGESEEVLRRQFNTLEAEGCKLPNIFMERVGPDSPRDKLNEAIAACKGGDTLVVTEADRLARNADHLLEIIERLERINCFLRILNWGGTRLDTSGPQGGFILSLLKGFGEFDRALRNERREFSLLKAMQEGRFRGPPRTARSNPAAVMELLDQQKKTPDRIAQLLGISRASVYRIIKEQRAGAADTQPQRQSAQREDEGERNN